MFDVLVPITCRIIPPAFSPRTKSCRTVGWFRRVNPHLPTILGEVAAEWLEPDDGKLSRPVLRGEGSRKAPDLPDRYVVYAGFYPTLDQIIVEHALRQAITGYGVPEAVYFDHGSQYTTKQMHRICTKLGIQLLYAKPYSP